MELTIAQAVVRMLADAGVRRGYTVPGESFLELLDAFGADPALTLVSTRHEGGAAFMAEADGKLHGTPAVAMASRGPGAANLSIGVHTAHQDRTPMLVLLGQVPSAHLGRESFQEVDLAAFYRPVAKWTAEARTSGEVPALVAEALAQARGGRPGPAIVSVPSDFWAARWDAALPVPEPKSPPPPPVEQVAALVDAADRPVVVTACSDAAARAELISTACELGLGVYNAFRRQDAFPEDHPNYAGHLGLAISDAQLRSLERADLVLLLGGRLDEITSQGHRFPLPDQRWVTVLAGLSPFLHGLRTTARSRRRDWSAASAAVREFTAAPNTDGTNGIHPADVVRTVRQLTPEDTVVTNDAGNFSGFLHRYWCFTSPRSQLGPCNGAMGYAVPAAVAAKLAAPERTVVAMVGDGGTLMTGQEIETAVRHRAPVIVVVFQNGLYGTIALHQAKKHGRLSAVDIGTVDFATWATALGAVGFTATTAQELATAVSAALRENRPTVIDVRTDPDVLTAEARLGPLLR